MLIKQYLTIMQIEKYNNPDELPVPQQNLQRNVSSTTNISDNDENYPQVELIVEDTQFQIHRIPTETNNQQIDKPPLCRTSLIIIVLLITIVLVSVGLYFVQSTQDAKGEQKMAQFIQKTTQATKIHKKQPENIRFDVTSSNTEQAESQGDISIKISDFPHFEINGEDIAKYGIHKDIQIGSIYDYLNITNSTQFRRFKKKWNTSIQAKIYELPKNPLLKRRPSILNYTNFKNVTQFENYLVTLVQWKNQQNYGPDQALYLGAHFLWNPNDQKLKQIELYYIEKKYKISNYAVELPICLFSTGFKIASRQRHINFLESIARQNYSNYHVVAVDDNSPDNTAEKMLEYLNSTQDAIRNKIKIVKNEKKLGATLSTYYWSRRLCNPKDIIVHVDMDDALIGHQVFKAINSIYHDPRIWYAYSRYIMQYSPADMPNPGKSAPINFRIQDYRHILDWKTSAMRTLRYEVMDNVPIQHLVQYHYDEKSQKLQPKFYDTDADRFLIYSQLQLCGNSHIRYVNDAFYYYNTSYSLSPKCNMRHEHFDEYKSKIKTRVKPMTSLQNPKIEFYDQKDSKIPQNVTDNLKDRYNKYQECKNSPADKWLY